MKLISLIFSLLISSIALAEEYRYPVETIKPLLVGAIKYGEAHGILVGQVADRMHKQFKSNEPILVDVKAVSSLPQKGCKRLSVAIKQDAVIDHGRPPESKETNYHIDFCDNGDFPPSEREVPRS